MNKVLVVSLQQAIYENLLENACLPGLELTQDPEQASIILADPPKVAGQLGHYPQLRWLQSTFAGIDALTQPGLRRDYALTNIKGCFGQLIAEYVLGLLLGHQRHFATYRQQQASQTWQPKPYQTIAGQTMVILGTGSIGSHLARVATAFGLRVVGVNRSGQANSPAFDTVYSLAQLPMALAQADILVSTLPATQDTDNLLDAAHLARCSGSLLFNVGRGNAVCEQGLLSALDSGAVEHAFLDVFKQEPLPSDSPLWQHPGITLTPHIAAESFPEQVMAIFCDNYHRWRQSQPLQYQVDFERGY
ncbi:D-2-hydroxyacid dehydrogenase [Photobacterium sanctipauli]|uniref:D-2-hydroxyacid dehydrogenase n=1 Tax=Photobacterium sanctipauli TaxID=1342794 RepID=A0A2T3ND74_9GAMM|nr:D-2-hydroxyacid dehydrogenase [Photobacterium sanctipauli]PSW12142.1 D-2-hydroxyacid dehydrogenase [Photobacterium sanctipauli]